MSTSEAHHGETEDEVKPVELAKRLRSDFSANTGATGESSLATQDARMLSKATSTAIVAAKSILDSGGDHTTALKTAKAAAQSILLGGVLQRVSSNGPKSMMLKRKMKKQAEVVASMALVSAINQTQVRADPILKPNENNDQTHSTYDVTTTSHLSAVSSFTRPTVFGIDSGTPSDRRSGLPPKPPPTKNTPTINPAKLREASFEEAFDLSPTNQAEEQTENQTENQSKINIENDESKSKAQDPPSLTFSSSSPCSPPNSPPSEKKTKTLKTVQTAKSSDDPLYSMSAYTPTSAPEEYDDTLYEGLVASSSESDGAASIATKKSFMSNHVDPLIFSFTRAFRCIPSGAVSLTKGEDEDSYPPAEIQSPRYCASPSPDPYTERRGKSSLPISMQSPVAPESELSPEKVEVKIYQFDDGAYSEEMEEPSEPEDEAIPEERERDFRRKDPGIRRKMKSMMRSSVKSFRRDERENTTEETTGKGLIDVDSESFSPREGNNDVSDEESRDAPEKGGVSRKAKVWQTLKKNGKKRWGRLQQQGDERYYIT